MGTQSYGSNGVRSSMIARLQFSIMMIRLGVSLAYFLWNDVRGNNVKGCGIFEKSIFYHHVCFYNDVVNGNLFCRKT
jgi:hypothetical protein